MRWQDRALKYFPDAALPDNPRPANLPSLPSSDLPPELGRLSPQEIADHDDHVDLWRDWLERCAIMEFDGGLVRDQAKMEGLMAVQREGNLQLSTYA